MTNVLSACKVLVLRDSNTCNTVFAFVMFIFYMETCMAYMYHTFMHMDESYQICVLGLQVLSGNSNPFYLVGVIKEGITYG